MHTKLKFNALVSVFELLKLQTWNVSKRYITSNSCVGYGQSISYIEEMYNKWVENPSNVDYTWKSLFENLDNIKPIQLNKITKDNSQINNTQNIIKISYIINEYRKNGHNYAKLNPLNTNEKNDNIEKLIKQKYDINDNIDITDETTLENVKTIKDLFKELNKMYCDTIGFEYSYLDNIDEMDWISAKIENRINYNNDKQINILKELMESHYLEHILSLKFPGEKRFGLEGCESLIPGIKELINITVTNDVEHISIGMSHRGRLNVLVNILDKPVEQLFGEFNGKIDYSTGNVGDVKYHYGRKAVVNHLTGKNINIILESNPSHLEAVNPVVMGRVKAIQKEIQDVKMNKALGVLIHGDAAFASQGVVYESLGMSNLNSFYMGGIIHIIVNNQIGFTTDESSGRYTQYCTSIAKSFGIPVIHVNAEDVESVVFACKLAAEWRLNFKKDIIIDIIGYRKNGHNEFDEPMFTQPKMYNLIKSKLSIFDIYSQKLLNKNILTESILEDFKTKHLIMLENAYNNSKTRQYSIQGWYESDWKGFKSLQELSKIVCPTYSTGVDNKILKTVFESLISLPQGFNLHPSIARIIDHRKKMDQHQMEIDMPTAESLAFGTLLLEGNNVRISGQDVERGTFTHRHCVFTNQKTNEKWTPLKSLKSNSKECGDFDIYNSSLSEYGVLGFEYGYSLVSPKNLVIWEAQFGDFSNNAQCVIDQFIISAERKWNQRSGIVMMLPHGYDGNGPEHSSARIERFLQLCDDNIISNFEKSNNKMLAKQEQNCNIQIVMPSTPASLFHILRRQIKSDFRKPLVIFTSKVLLRHPRSKSAISEFGLNTSFKTVIIDPLLDKSSKKKAVNIIFCSGQISYQLISARDSNKDCSNIYICRLEQISPFPYNEIRNILQDLNILRITWVQEEPCNMGMWTYIQPHFTSILESLQSIKNLNINLVSRPISCSVATGFKKIHNLEEEQVISRALFGEILQAKERVNNIPIFMRA